MGSKTLFLVFTLCFFSLVYTMPNNTATSDSSSSLNSLVQDFAFKSMIKHKHKPQTGAVYDALLPRNFSGMNVSVVRLRSRRLWNKGANFSYFMIPPRTISTPHVKRVAIVYQNLGNWSSHYFNLPGYSLVSSVVGFLVFDATNINVSYGNKTSLRIRNLTLNTMGQPISIKFPNVGKFFKSREIRCVAFNANGTFELSELSSNGVCYSRDQGHFSVIVPLEEDEKKRRQWYLWMIGFVVGFCVLIGCVCVGFLLYVRLVKAKRIQAMERQANEDLVLESRWVGNSKMPSAAVTRTQPVLESGVP